MKKLVEFLNKLYDEGVFSAFAYIITLCWFVYISNIVRNAEGGIIGKIFFFAWSIVLALVYIVHKCNDKDEQ